jgi:hypothetical protein
LEEELVKDSILCWERMKWSELPVFCVQCFPTLMSVFFHCTVVRFFSRLAWRFSFYLFKYLFSPQYLSPNTFPGLPSATTPYTSIYSWPLDCFFYFVGLFSIIFLRLIFLSCRMGHLLWFAQNCEVIDPYLILSYYQTRFGFSCSPSPGGVTTRFLI